MWIIDAVIVLIPSRIVHDNLADILETTYAEMLFGRDSKACVSPTVDGSTFLSGPEYLK